MEQAAKPKANNNAKRAKPAQDQKDGEAAPKANEATGPVLRKKDFVEKVLQASGDVNKSDAKIVIEKTLEQILFTLRKGETLAIPPLGKVRLSSSTQKDDGERLAVRIKVMTDKEEKS